MAEAYILWRLKDGAKLIDFLSTLSPSHHTDPQYWLLYGLGLRMQSEPLDSVVNAYQTGLSLDCSRSDLHFNLANTLIESDPYLALRHFSASLILDPLQGYAWHNLGILFNSIDHYENAVEVLKYSLILDPASSDAWCNLGISYLALEDFDSAQRCFVHAISLDPSNISGLTNLGSLLISSRKPDEALKVLQCPSVLSQGSSHALFNLSLCHLLLGEFSTGWFYYEERFNTSLVPRSCFPSSGPLLASLDDAPTKVEESSPLIVWAEQGAGDCIQFLRYLRLLQSRNIHFEFHCSNTLLPLVRDWFDSSIVLKELSPSGSELETSIHCPLLSLPRLFSTNLSTIPSSLPYFQTSSSTPEHLLVPTPPGGISIGLVWGSHSANKKMYKKKSIPLELLMPRLLDLVSLDLISINCLQIGPDQEQLAPWLSTDGIKDWSTSLHSFSDTAFVLRQLDLVISVDTAVAHLSASLNRPTWIMLPWDSDFRWLLSRSDSPWYPGTVRLFRQPSRADWDGLIEDLFSALDDLFMLDIEPLASAKGKRPASR